MNKIAFLFLSLLTSIYSLQLHTAEGATVNMSAFQGKKLLLVNIATGSTMIGQIGELQQLQQLYADSLTVIAFPSNSFGNEQRSNEDILSFCRANYAVTFPIAQEAAVVGENVQPFYQWLRDSTHNGAMNAVIEGDFQKFLLSGNGEIIGVFAPAIRPMDSLIQKAIVIAN